MSLARMGDAMVENTFKGLDSEKMFQQGVLLFVEVLIEPQLQRQ